MQFNQFLLSCMVFFTCFTIAASNLKKVLPYYLSQIAIINFLKML